MNKWAAGGVLAFAFGVAAITQTGLEFGPKSWVKGATDALAGRAGAVEKAETAASAAYVTSNGTILEAYKP